MTSPQERTAAFRRNRTLEELLARLNDALASAARPPSEGADPPALFIMGAPRTGSTYCLQWLAASGAFSWPSNLIARFWRAPFVGALVQEMLADPALDYRGELADMAPGPIEARSDAGKTTGALSPSEFWYFWRAHLPGDGDVGLDLSRATPAQFAAFADELAQLAEVRGRPVALKGKIVNHQMEAFAAGMPNALFLFVDREPVAAAWSLLEARRRIFGDAAAWWSFRTPDHEALRRLPPHAQVAGQVARIRRDVAGALARLGPDRGTTLRYQELCADPDAAFARVAELFVRNGVRLEGASAFGPSEASRPDIPAEDRRLLEAALEEAGAAPETDETNGAAWRP